MERPPPKGPQPPPWCGYHDRPITSCCARPGARDWTEPLSLAIVVVGLCAGAGMLLACGAHFVMSQVPSVEVPADYVPARRVYDAGKD